MLVYLVLFVSGVAAAPGQIVDSGRQPFESRCARCHGADGNGGDMGGRQVLPRRRATYGERPDAGTPLWSFPTNHTWKASPMTYMFDGKQVIAVAAGPTIIALAIPD